MNINEIKAVLGDKPKHLGKDNSVQNQLRDAGLQQAVSAQDNQASILTSQLSSNTSVAVHVYNNSLNGNLIINQHRANLPIPKSEEAGEVENKGLFDFEKIAKNVLNFIGGAVKNAQAKGADEASLSNLFDQATSGVLKGIKMAKEELSGIMNEDIENGIGRSQELIEQGIEKLKEEIFGTIVEPQVTASSQTVSQSVNYEKSESSELQVVTKDGDKVKIVFESLGQFELHQRQIGEQHLPVKPELTSSPPVDDTEGNGVPADTQPLPIEASKSDGPIVGSKINSENYQYIQSSTLSFSVKGNLDEDELRAIGDLVAKANSLADEFFNGDIEKAYNQALELGFDDQELTGFALQLTRQEQAQVIQTYESVSHFKDNSIDADAAKVTKPVAHYLDKMLDLVEESRQKLQEGSSFDNLLNDLINQMGEVHTPDLIQALNRFHSFNKKLMDNLPNGGQQQ